MPGGSEKLLSVPDAGEGLGPAACSLGALAQQQHFAKQALGFRFLLMLTPFY